MFFLHFFFGVVLKLFQFSGVQFGIFYFLFGGILELFRVFFCAGGFGGEVSSFFRKIFGEFCFRKKEIRIYRCGSTVAAKSSKKELHRVLVMFMCA